ncbi:MAG: stage II sporulation protein M [Nanoarchaeota archaeon]|nr:stage II sporulation protein M [Nanoarchaeota archaeon]
MSIKDHYGRSYRIIKENKRIIIAIAILYLVSLSGGIVYHTSTYEGFSSIEAGEDYYKYLKESDFGRGFFGNFLYIFMHNLVASLFRIIGGIFFGIIPLFSMIDQGVSNGFGLVSFTMNNGFSNSLLFFVPHSLFELPALFLASSFGVTLFLSLFKKGERIRNLKASVIDSMIVFFLWILPLLLIAGFIESILIMIYWF